MTFLVLVALYFLPAILGYHKRDAAGIFLLNFLLGWTVIGWIASMVWALAAERERPVLVLAGPGRFCCVCGTVNVIGARFCAACGRAV